jgi:general secretion pathway protein A
VDLATAMNALEFLRLIAHPLGISVTNRLGAARLRLREALEAEAADGRPWLLVIDEAQRGSLAVWDEIQAIVNHLGESDAFAAVLVAGQTELARTLESRRQRAFAASVSIHIHLMPLDLDEARDLLGCTEYADAGAQQALEEVHRDAGGNPAMLLRLAQLRPGPWRIASNCSSNRAHSVSAHAVWPRAVVGMATNQPRERSDSPGVPQQTDESKRSAGPAAGALIPSKPPIRDEDGLVEVGWEGDLEADLDGAGGASPNADAISADDRYFAEESIEDRYAALQAWTEQKQNLARPEVANPASALPVRTLEESIGPEDVAARESPTGLESPAGASRQGIRAEGQHEFPPFSQLFTRYRQSKQPGS